MAYYSPVGDHTAVTDVSTVQTITLPATATGILCQALTQNVRLRMDGGTPTTSVGFQIKAGDPPIYLPMAAGDTFKILEETASANFQYQAVKLKG